MSDCFYPFVCLSKSVHMYVKHIRYFFICMRMLNSFVFIFFVAFLPFTPIYGYLQPDFYRPQGFSLSNIRKCSNKSFFVYFHWNKTTPWIHIHLMPTVLSSMPHRLICRNLSLKDTARQT